MISLLLVAQAHFGDWTVAADEWNLSLRVSKLPKGEACSSRRIVLVRGSDQVILDRWEFASHKSLALIKDDHRVLDHDTRSTQIIGDKSYVQAYWASRQVPTSVQKELETLAHAVQKGSVLRAEGPALRTLRKVSFLKGMKQSTWSEFFETTPGTQGRALSAQHQTGASLRAYGPAGAMINILVTRCDSSEQALSSIRDRHQGMSAGLPDLVSRTWCDTAWKHKALPMFEALKGQTFVSVFTNPPSADLAEKVAREVIESLPKEL